VIDDLPYDSEDIPQVFRDLTWLSAQGGPSDSFVEEVRQLYRRNQAN